MSPPARGALSGADTHVLYLDYLRAVAILQIVALHAGHAFLLRGFAAPVAESNPVFTAVDVLFRNATVYFSMISGILYARIFRHRPYVPFMRARLLNTGVPYLVVTAALTIWAWYRSSAGEEGDTIELVRLIVYNAVLGEGWNTLWYIPVILLLYAISPLLVRLVVAPKWRWAALLLIVLPLGFSRTGTEITPSIIIYFMGAYVTGLWLGRDLEAAVEGIGKRAGWIALSGALASAALVFVYLRDVNPAGPISLRESLFYVQRLSIGLLLLAALRLWSYRAGPVSDTVLSATASASFGLYFLHGPLVRPVVALVSPFIPSSEPYWGLLLGVGMTFAGGLLLSWTVICGFRLLLGRRSRLVIGA